MSEPNDAPVSFRVAAGKLGWGSTRAAGRKLEKMVLERERETGHGIALRKRGHRRTRRTITLGSLFRALPELRPHRSIASLTGEFRRYISAIDERVRVKAREESEAAIAEIVQPQLDQNRTDIELVHANLNELARRVAISPDKPS